MTTYLQLVKKETLQCTKKEPPKIGQHREDFWFFPLSLYVVELLLILWGVVHKMPSPTAHG